MRLQRPYSHLLRASHFPRDVEICDVEHARRVDASSLPQDRDITPTKGKGLPEFSWNRSEPATIGWTKADGDGERWVAVDLRERKPPREVARSRESISQFGWTSQGTPLFATVRDRGAHIRYFVVRKDGGAQQVWNEAMSVSRARTACC